MEKALTDFGYAIIRSPISGTVIDRAVEQGQTVAASFSTPTLFTIAKDMTRMEIEALVDESDIGSIQTGQKVRFTVQSYQEKTFNGVVKQVRLQPTTVSNVVNYTVIIEADNKEQLLLPGMTATVDFIIDSRENVLTVPNNALKIKPTEKMMAEAMKPGAPGWNKYQIQLKPKCGNACHSRQRNLTNPNNRRLSGMSTMPVRRLCLS